MTQATSFRIIVVGAGLSGLSAALLLDRAGYDLTVLEARTNAGGRVRTLREPFADGLYAEAGATYVSPGHENVTRWCAHFGLELDPFPATDLVARYFVRGRHWRPLEEPQAAGLFDLTPEERALGLPGMLGKYVAAVVGEAVAGSTSRDWPPESLRRFDKMTFAEFLAAQGASPDAAALLGLGFGSVWGDGPSSYSALANLRYMMGEAMYAGPDASPANAPWQVIRGGSDLLPRAFADALRGRIRYGSPVVRIEQDESGVRAVVRRGETTEAFSGDRIVCAIPFSTLRDVEVAPSFSPPKAKAIRELRYSSTTRVYLQARARFWNEPWHVLATDEPVGVVRHATFNQPGPRAIVEAYLFGAQGRRAAGQTEPERIRTTAAGLAPILPGLASELEGGASYSWFTDPWARGSEAWYAPGEELANFPHHATVEGRVHFAGEHTDLTAGMHGAIGSGERVAREIVGSF